VALHRGTETRAVTHHPRSGDKNVREVIITVARLARYAPNGPLDLRYGGSSARTTMTIIARTRSSNSRRGRCRGKVDRTADMRRLAGHRRVVTARSVTLTTVSRSRRRVGTVYTSVKVSTMAARGRTVGVAKGTVSVRVAPRVSRRGRRTCTIIVTEVRKTRTDVRIAN
jgi:hypothetical protein